MPVDIVLDLAGGNLAVVRGQGDDLVAGGLDGAGLVAVDVSARGGENALPRAITVVFACVPPEKK